MPASACCIKSAVSKGAATTPTPAFSGQAHKKAGSAVAVAAILKLGYASFILNVSGLAGPVERIFHTAFESTSIPEP